MPREALLDLSTVDFNHIVVDQDGIRQINPQRYEMEQLNAIVHMDRENHIVVGYKDVRPDEFWVRGHMPGFPLMPGVIMCEAGAQLTAYYWKSSGLIEGDFIAFGGMENVRFRGPVRIGDRFVIVAKSLKFHRRQVHMRVQGFVGKTMVFEGDVIGVPFHKAKES